MTPPAASANVSGLSPRPRRRRRLLLGGLGCLGFALAVWLAGFLWFAETLPEAPPREAEATDAIVVLTGGRGRLQTGLALLEAGQGRALFISGVYRGIDVEELLRLARHAPDRVACCITLGYAADDTRGNARETADWMARAGHRSLRIVTAGYHMPRALLEFEAAMPKVRLLAHPVFPAQVKLESWWLWPGTVTLLVEEYSKWLAAGLQLTVVGVLGGNSAAGADKAAMR